MQTKLLFVFLFSLPAFAGELSFVEKRGTLEEWTIEQTINRADILQSAKYKQHFFLDRKYAKTNASPIILEICGEWFCNGRISKATTVAAKENGALIVTAEHRYYGKSQPFTSQTTENLKFLTTDFALEDLAELIQSLRKEMQLSGPWITIGCSYAGSLSAYMRAFYPDLINGSVAVSGPVEARAVWPGFDAHVAKVLGPECAAKAKANLWEMEARILQSSDAEFAQLRLDLGVEKTKTRGALVEVLSDVIRGTIQQNSYEEFCAEIKAEDITPFFNYAKMNIINDGLDDFSIDAVGDELEGVNNPESGVRQWYYQTCTEYGYFQVHDPVNGIGAHTITEDFYLKNGCATFGITKMPDTDKFNETHLKRVRESDKILFTNSAVDAWSRLSIRPDNSEGTKLQATISDTGAHCMAMYEFDGDGKPTTEGSRMILDAIREWSR
jgi:hypothetical protein